MIRGIILDLDGTVYLGDEEVPGAAAFVQQMRDEGIRCLFVTNRSNRPAGTVCEQLTAYGIDCSPEEILTSAHATAGHLPPGSAYVIGEAGLIASLEAAGFTLTSRSPDYVIVGYDRSFDYGKLKIACRAIEGGARFIATNPDRAIKLEDGISPGTGAILAAITCVTDKPPQVIGKPGPIIFTMAVRQLGLEAHEVIAVGDSIETDVCAGINAGLRTVLLMTGVSTEATVKASRIQPTWLANNYDELHALVKTDNLVAAQEGTQP